MRLRGFLLQGKSLGLEPPSVRFPCDEFTSFVCILKLNFCLQHLLIATRFQSREMDERPLACRASGCNPRIYKDAPTQSWHGTRRGLPPRLSLRTRTSKWSRRAWKKELKNGTSVSSHTYPLSILIVTDFEVRGCSTLLFCEADVATPAPQKQLWALELQCWLSA